VVPLEDLVRHLTYSVGEGRVFKKRTSEGTLKNGSALTANLGKEYLRVVLVKNKTRASYKLPY